ncbi:hypothetical protein HDU97_003796 [Phlyctochytrium planicorne]|nr:hypothetical protein HDU97_003796 [Phlyctochytrium planicorne]
MAYTNFNDLNPYFGSLDDLLSPNQPLFSSSSPESSSGSSPNQVSLSLDDILRGASIPTTSNPFLFGVSDVNDLNFNFDAPALPPINESILFEAILREPFPSPQSHPISPNLTDSASEPDSGRDVNANSNTTTVKVPGKRGRKKKELTLEQQEEKSKERQMKNREAAQHSRDKKRKYMEELEETNSTLSKRLVLLENQNQTLLSRLEDMAMQMAEMRGILQVGKGVGGEDRKFINSLAQSADKSKGSWSVRLISSLIYPTYSNNYSASSSTPKDRSLTSSPLHQQRHFSTLAGSTSDRSLRESLANLKSEKGQLERIGSLIPASSKADLAKSWWTNASRGSLFPNLGLFRSRLYASN